MAKKYKVGFKTINAKLEVTKEHLGKIRKHVTPKERKKIDAQIKAIGVILAACGGKNPKMSAYYQGGNED